MLLVRLFRAFACWVALATAGFADPTSSPSPTAPALQRNDGLYAEITTPHGALWCELFPAEAPLTVTSFVGLAEGTLGPEPRKPFFDGLTFHRVVPDFVVQGGDPTATGDGGPGYRFADEFASGRGHDGVGVLSMANDGPDTNGSQFFLTLRPVKRLDYLHSVFGQVVGGREVLPRIKQGDTFSVRIHRIGEQARAFKADDATFAARRARAKTFTYTPRVQAEPGPQAHFADPDGLLPAEPPRAKTFNFKLANVERSTGLRIVGRLFRRSPTAEEDAVAGQFMRNLARAHGTEQRGATFAYFEDEKDWRVWIGDESVEAFFGRKASAAELGEGADFHTAKEAFLQQVRTRGAEDLARQRAAAKPDQPLPAGQPLKLETDAMIDGLIERLRRP